MAFVFFTELPLVGYKIKFQHTNYEAVAVQPYTRKSDGALSSIVTWRAICSQCGNAFTFTTGGTQGTFRQRCFSCFKDGAKRAEILVRAERLVENIPDAMTIHRAVATVYPCRMSMAKNTARHLYAPAILRNASPDLGAYTLAEIAEAIKQAMPRYVNWKTVARTKGRRALKGLWPRPLDAARDAGLIPDAPQVDVFT
jgi:hypothetical protein